MRSAPAPIKANPNKIPDKLKHALSVALDSAKWPIYLHGPAGVGKTSAAACVYRLWPKGLCFLWPASTLLADLARARADGTHGLIRNSVTDAGLIVIDDIATREPTAAQLDAMLLVLTWRGNKPLIITGNLNPSQLSATTDRRVASRVCGGVVIECGGADMRLAEALVLKA